MTAKCPNCQQHKLYTHGELARLIGIMAGPLGLFLIWIPFIGLPLLIVGVILFFGSFVPGANKKHICLNCNYKD